MSQCDHPVPDLVVDDEPAIQRVLESHDLLDSVSWFCPVPAAAVVADTLSRIYLLIAKLGSFLLLASSSGMPCLPPTTDR
jgi:hypothetical protein